MPDVPWIDPEIRYYTITDLKTHRVEMFSEHTSIITNQGKPVSVLIPYDAYLKLQSLAELSEIPKKVAVPAVKGVGV